MAGRRSLIRRSGSLGWFGYLNLVIFLANLIPALPFDGGRIVRAYFSHTSVSSAKDNMIAAWAAPGRAP